MSEQGISEQEIKDILRANRNELANDVRELLQENIIPWAELSELGYSAPINPVTGYANKGINLIAIETNKIKNNYDSNLCVTEKQANDVGFEIRPEEKEKGQPVERKCKDNGGNFHTQPGVVYNIEQLESDAKVLGDRVTAWFRPEYSNFDQADAILKKAGIDIPEEKEKTQLAIYSAALEKVLGDALEKNPSTFKAFSPELLSD